MRDRKPILDPIDRTSEVIFGLIIVLTFTCSFGFRRVDHGEVRTVLLEVIGCSVAWGIIDAAFYLLGCLSEKGHNLMLVRQVRSNPDAADAKQIISDALPPLIATHLHCAVYESLYQQIRELPELPDRPKLAKDDLKGALAVFLLAFLSIAPVIIPFTFLSDLQLALRISNTIAVILLFLAGYALGRHASQHPWQVGLGMVVVGAALVGVAIILGG